MCSMGSASSPAVRLMSMPSSCTSVDSATGCESLLGAASCCFAHFGLRPRRLGCGACVVSSVGLSTTVASSCFSATSIIAGAGVVSAGVAGTSLRGWGDAPTFMLFIRGRRPRLGVSAGSVMGSIGVDVGSAGAVVASTILFKSSPFFMFEGVMPKTFAISRNSTMVFPSNAVKSCIYLV